MSGARYVEPLTVGEAVAALAENSGARCLAGGQTLVAMMNAGLVEPPLVVGLRRVAELKVIDFDATGSVVTGAMTTHAALARESRLSSGHAVLREAAVTIAHPAIRNLGTLGGALSHADPNADYPPAALAADAEIEVVGPAGRRTIRASDFFLDFLTAAIEPGEIVTKIRVPPPAPGSTGVYEKFARVDGDYATASIAVVLAMTGANCSFIRVAVGACGPTPVRSPEAEQLMIGTELDAAALAHAGQILVEAIDPVDDVRGSAEYRRMLVPRLLTRAVQRALFHAASATVSDPYPVTLTVNGDEVALPVSPVKRLIDVLRYDLGLTGTKRGCNQGVCGSCTVLLDGEPVRSCLSLVGSVSGMRVTTIEGLACAGRPSPVQQAFLDTGAIQCGFCMPGLIIAATALLASEPCPNAEQIRHAIAGNLCRCSGYVKVVEAIRVAAARNGKQPRGASA